MLRQIAAVIKEERKPTNMRFLIKLTSRSARRESFRKPQMLLILLFYLHFTYTPESDCVNLLPCFFYIRAQLPFETI